MLTELHGVDLKLLAALLCSLRREDQRLVGESLVMMGLGYF